jgi:hypothetical protein
MSCTEPKNTDHEVIITELHVEVTAGALVGAEVGAEAVKTFRFPYFVEEVCIAVETSFLIGEDRDSRLFVIF